MTIPMYNTLESSSRERVQSLYSENVALENRRCKAAQARIPSDPNGWQMMRENYEAIILEDHAFSEQHEIKYALWQVHYRRIEALRAHLRVALASADSIAPQDGKGPAGPGTDLVTKIRSQFKTFLSEATGFYHDLMVKIRAKYGFPLGYFSDDLENQILAEGGNGSAEVKKGLISCHRCLIYLGDLARYKGLYGEGESKGRDFAAASSYYMQASYLWPSSGNPHHQLAIIASYMGDEFVAIYRYFRSVAVDNPFTTARDNLIIAFEKNRQCYSQLLGDAQASAKMASARITRRGRGTGETKVQKDNRVKDSLVKERSSSISETLKAFRIRFIRLNGILFTRTSFETFGEVFSMAKSDFLKLLAAGPDEEYNFGSDATECRILIVRLVAILIFTVHDINRETEKQSYAEILQRSVLLQNAFTAAFEFVGHILERCTQLNDPSTSYMLPGIMVFLEWLACRQDIAVGTDVEEKQASARLVFWNHCVSLLNKLFSNGFSSTNEDGDETCFFNMSRYNEGETSNRLALLEDFELRGFLPLLPAQLILDFSRKYLYGSDGGNRGKKARIHRIIAAGKALANLVHNGKQGIHFDPKLKKFSIGVEPQTSIDTSFSSYLEASRLIGRGHENLADSESNMEILQRNPQLCMEGEDEDEVIVFKPTVSEKLTDGVVSEFTSSEVLLSDVSSFMVDLGINTRAAPPSNDGLLQNTLYTTSRLPTSLNKVPALQPIQPTTSTWPVEQVSIAKELNNLSFLERFPMKHELQDCLGALHSTAVSVPFPHQFINRDMGSKDPVHFPDISVPSKFNLTTSSETIEDSLYVKSSSMMPAAFRKNTVSRPVRHSGPPPGFSSLPPKLVNEFLSDARLMNGGLEMNNYSWLEGYQLASFAQGIGFNNSTNQSAQGHDLASKTYSLLGMISFPFPRKQASTLQAQPQHQLDKGNQNSAALPEQNYQGRNLWDGRFVV